MRNARYTWILLVSVVAGLWLWSQRYEYIQCDTEGVCVVANRYTGHVGLMLTPLKRGELYQKFPQAMVDSLFHDARP